MSVSGPTSKRLDKRVPAHIRRGSPGGVLLCDIQSDHDSARRVPPAPARRWTQRPRHGSFASIEWGVGGRRGIFVVGYMEIAAAIEARRASVA